ncbi:hypothetical protein, partial [Mycobacterium sp.]|uniref:hypothetical protein n=1 Tax=Mycobacterium sp. TaxID=1785 RepID=UPI0025E8D3FF
MWLVFLTTNTWAESRTVATIVRSRRTGRPGLRPGSDILSQGGIKPTPTPANSGLSRRPPMWDILQMKYDDDPEK